MSNLITILHTCWILDNISIKAQRCKDFKMCLAPQRNAHFSKKQFMNMIELIKKALWFGQTPVYCLPNMLVGTGGMSFPLFHLESWSLTCVESQLQSSESASAITLEGCTAAMPALSLCGRLILLLNMTPWRILQIEFDDPKKNRAISSVEVVPRTLVLSYVWAVVSLHSPNKKNCRNVVDARVDSLRLRPGSEKLEALQVKRKTGKYQQHLAEISDESWGESPAPLQMFSSLILGTLLKQQNNAHFHKCSQLHLLPAAYWNWIVTRII